jgi:hypothetical protein
MRPREGKQNPALFLIAMFFRELSSPRRRRGARKRLDIATLLWSEIAMVRHSLRLEAKVSTLPP